jgi:hypothetical protein
MGETNSPVIMGEKYVICSDQMTFKVIMWKVCNDFSKSLYCSCNVQIIQKPLSRYIDSPSVACGLRYFSGESNLFIYFFFILA